MELVKLGKKGQVTIPRSVLRAAGIAEESRGVLEAYLKRKRTKRWIIRVFLDANVLFSAAYREAGPDARYPRPETVHTSESYMASCSAARQSFFPSTRSNC